MTSGMSELKSSLHNRPPHTHNVYRADPVKTMAKVGQSDPAQKWRPTDN